MPIRILELAARLRPTCWSMKVVWLRADPGDERRDLGLRPQRLDIWQPTLELLLGKQRVDDVVADLVEQDLRPKLSASRSRNEMMLGLSRCRRDQSLAERAARCLVGIGLDFFELRLNAFRAAHGSCRTFNVLGFRKPAT